MTIHTFFARPISSIPSLNNALIAWVFAKPYLQQVTQSSTGLDRIQTSRPQSATHANWRCAHLVTLQTMSTQMWFTTTAR